MSYDIAFKVKAEGCTYWVDTGFCGENITWNVGKIIRKATGLEWRNEENNGLVKDVVPHLIDGIQELELHPERYRHMEPDNGWGTLEGTVRFFMRILEDWNRLVSYEEHIDFGSGKKLSDVVCFWIE